MNLHPSIQTLELPERMKDLPIDPRLFPIPWFVRIEENGVADFRVIGMHKIAQAIQQELCWICGKRLGSNVAYVIGPMCSVNRVSSEPPSHRECAIYAAKACPFLARPHARRRGDNLPEEARTNGDFAIMRNPGVTLVWVTMSKAKDGMFRAGDAVLFNVGDPIETLWFSEGREATRDEVLYSIDTGLPLLMAEAEKEGKKAVEQLARQVNSAMRYVPAEQATVVLA